VRHEIKIVGGYLDCESCGRRHNLMGLSLIEQAAPGVTRQHVVASGTVEVCPSCLSGPRGLRGGTSLPVAA